MTGRTIANALLAACFLALAAAPPGATATATAQETPPETRVVTFTISGMLTPNCPVLVQSAVSRIDGVQSVRASLERRNAVVRYVVGKTSPEQIRRVIEDRTGFRAAVERR